MPFVPAPNCASVELIFENNGQRSENVFNVEAGTPYDLADLNTLALWFENWWTTNLAPIVPDTVSLVLIVCKALDSNTAPAVEYATGLPSQGTATTWTQLPNNVTVAVRWSTGLRGRSYRGRTYHVGLAQEQVTGNTVDSAFRIDLAEAYTLIIDEVSTLPGTLVVLSKYANGVERTTAVTTPIIAASIDATIDSQRRRLPGRGE